MFRFGGQEEWGRGLTLPVCFMMMDEGPGGGAAEADAEEAAGPGEVVDKKPWLKDPRALTR